MGLSQDPVNAAGYLRALHLTFDGVTTAGGPFTDLMTDPRYRRSWLRRCKVARCQRTRGHRGEHYRRRRWPRRFWAWADDAPFSLIEKWEIRDEQA